MIEDSDKTQVSICSLESNQIPTWKKICKKYTTELKKKYERAYAFGLYRIHTFPPEEIKDLTHFTIDELKLVTIQKKTA